MAEPFRGTLVLRGFDETGLRTIVKGRLGESSYLVA
jgi:hypothetical protein